MAYVHPRHTSGEFAAAALRNGTRVVAAGAYAAAVVVAVLLLAPVLFDGDSGSAARIPAGPRPVTVKLTGGDTPATVAAARGLSLAQLYALNPGLAPLPKHGQSLVVGLR
jgi:hypothetical protein